MAIDPYASKSYDPAWDDFAAAHSELAETPGTPAAGDLDVETLTRLIGQSQQITGRLTERDTGRVPAWARAQPAKVAYWSTAVPTLVSGMANLSAHQWPGWEVPATGGAVMAFALVATIAGLNRHWASTGVAVSSGITLGALQFATASGSGGWMEVVAWLTGAAGCVAYSIVWNRKHAKAKAEEELIKAKTGTEHAKQDASRIMTQVKATHELLKIQAAQAAAAAPSHGLSYTPFLRGDESAVESTLLAAFTPGRWADASPERGLEGTSVVASQLTDAGIVVDLRLDGRWDTPKVRAAEGQIRALSSMPTDVRMQIKPGTTGDQTRLYIRTRSKTDGLVMTGWKPGDVWAVDTVTGEAVPVPLGKRVSIAGTSGSGKSWSARPLLAEASEYDDHRLVIFDRKYIEAKNWEHRARIAVELDEMRELCVELIAEGEERLKDIPRGQDVVRISADRPRITVFVDEMGEMISDAKGEYEDIMTTLRTIARKYRAAEIILVPATQKPTVSGEGHGMDSQVSAQMTAVLCLAVRTQTESQTVFGPDAVATGWTANTLPMPGYALMRNLEDPAAEPNPLKMRAMSPADVIALPERPVWRRKAPVRVAPEDLVARFLLENPGASQRAIAEGTGVPRTTVQRILTES